MTQHILQGRTEEELLWYQRRSFLQAAATLTALGGFASAQAQVRSNIVQLMGDATVNGAALSPQQTIQTGDDIVTGPKSTLIFVIGTAAFHVRQNSRLTVERGPTLNAVSVLRLLTGAVASVWGKGTSRQIITPTLTAGIRGTGVYTEALAERSYFCNCYGTVDFVAGNERVTSVAEYHKAIWSQPNATNSPVITPANAINHTDEELEYLARLTNQRTAWQITGKKPPKSMYKR